MKTRIVVGVCILLLTSCLKEKIPFHYTISVDIIQAGTNEAVKGADVYLYFKDGSTLNKVGEQKNIDGNCMFEGLEREGSYLIRVKCEPKYRDGDVSVELHNDGKEFASVSLELF